MIKLMTTSINRMFKDKIFIILMIITMAFPYYIQINEAPPIRFDQAFIYYYIIAGSIIAVFSSMFVGLDYEEGTIRNKVVIGHKRSHIYLSNLLVSVIFALIFYLIFAIMMPFVVNPVFKDITENEIRIFLLTLGSMIISFFVYSSIFSLISMNISSRTISLVINVIIAILLISIPIKSSEIVSTYAYNQFIRENHPEEITEETAVRYNHPTKEEAKRAQLVLDITPVGHLIQVSTTTEEKTPTLILFFYSIFSFILFTIVGLVLFKKKELK